MEKKANINQELVDKWLAVHLQVGELEKPIVERLDYIIRFLFEVFGCKLNYWYFSGYDEEEQELYENFDREEISRIYVGCDWPDDLDEIVIIDKFNSEFGWEGCIPTRWLFEDFEEEIIKGKAEYEKREREKEAAKKEKQLAKKAKEEAVMKELKSKLTAEELAVLKKNL